MAVGISSDRAEPTGYNYEFNYENAIKDFNLK